MPFDLTAVLAGITGLLERPLFALGTQAISLGWLLEASFLLLGVVVFAKAVKWFIKERVLVRFQIAEGNREVISALVGFLLMAGGSLTVLQAMGLKLESLGLVLGGLGIGVGFGLQDLTKSLVSGVTLLAERKLKVGDLVEFKGKEGFIKEISIRSTVIRTFRGSEWVVPNTELANESVENRTYTNARGRVDLTIPVRLGSDPVLVTELLLRAAYGTAGVLFEPAPRVLLVRIGDGAMEFLLWVWVDQIDRALGVKSALNFATVHLFEQHGVNFAGFVPELGSMDSLGSAARSGPDSPAQTPAPGPSETTLRSLLPKLRYFRQFDDVELRELIEAGCQRQLRHGEILVHQGQRLAAFCLVLSGRMEAYYENRLVSQRLFTFGEGEYFGELPLLLKIPYPTTMRAVGGASLFLVAEQGFLSLLDRHAELRVAVIEESERRQQEIQLCQDSLRELGLLEDEHPKGPVAWFRRRLATVLGG